jgi:hypothetical protein
MTLIQRTIVSCWNDAVGLGSIVCHTKSKKNDGNGNQLVDDEPFIDERKSSSTTVAKGVSNNGPLSTTVAKNILNNGEHTLIPVTAQMIHFAVWDLKRFVLKDGQPLYMVKLVGATRNFRGDNKHIEIDVEDGTGLVRVILWRNKRECTAQHHLLDKCNSNCYIRLIGEVEDYYGVHEIIAFDV